MPHCKIELLKDYLEKKHVTFKNDRCLFSEGVKYGLNIALEELKSNTASETTRRTKKNSSVISSI